MPERPPQSAATGDVASVPERPNGPFTIHVVAHTHWDREWYHSASRFGARLTGVIDALLARDTPHDSSAFLLDGQAIVLRDYLTIRSDRKDEIVRALASGWIEAGPWYVLADNLIPSGEAIIRNLEAGRRLLARLGAGVPRVMYCPDTFGHPASLPAIAAGFGCDVAVVWRGFGGQSFPAADSAWWQAADHQRVLLYHLPPDGYEFGSALPVDPVSVSARWATIKSVLTARNHTGHALLTVGADHHARSPDHTDAITKLAAHAARENVRVVPSTLSAACAALYSAACTIADTSPSAITIVRGELRDSYGYTWTLSGTLGTRAQLKRQNARLERALLRDVEPWLALAWLHAPSSAFVTAADGSLNLTQLPTLTAHAWQMLLETHPHDTLCGCSIDSVAAQMVTTQQSVASLVPELRDNALALSLAHDRVAVRALPVCEKPPVVVRNRASYARGGIAEIRLIETIGDVVVGPGGANATQPSEEDARVGEVGRRAAADALDGCVVQFERHYVTHHRRESPQHYPDNDLVRVHDVVAWVPAVPAHGLRVLAASRDGSARAESAPATPVSLTRHGDAWRMDNGVMRVEVADGNVTIAVGGRRLSNALTLETIVDVGDSYTPALRGDPESLTFVKVRAGSRGPLRASIHVKWKWKRGSESIVVWTTLILDAEATFVRCDVHGTNRRRNHRLQLVWHTDVRDAHVVADAAFGPVTREPIQPLSAPASTPIVERPPQTMPLHRWLTAYDAQHGVTLLSDGLAEGEALPGRLSVTLLRAIGELSRGNLPERPGHAGWPCNIPVAQSLGGFRARVGLMMHESLRNGTLSDIENAADALLTPLVADSWRDLQGDGRELQGPTLHGDGFVSSAVHLSDDASTLVLRAVNYRDVSNSGAWVLPEGAWKARRARLDGTPLGEWFTTSSHIPLSAEPRDIVTYQVQRATPRDATERE